jgi:hypothetical protein
MPLPLFFIYEKEYVHFTRPQAQNKKEISYKRLLGNELIFSFTRSLTLRETACISLTKNLLHYENDKEAASKIISFR